MNENFIKVKKIILEYYWIAIIPIMIWGFFLVMGENQDIDRNKTESFGEVYSSKKIYNQFSKRHYLYKFYYNDKLYYGSSIGYVTDNIENGNFYKVELSSKSPKNNRMIFDLEYKPKFKTKNNGKVIDTIYVPIDQKFKNEMKKQINRNKFIQDSMKN